MKSQFIFFFLFFLSRHLACSQNVKADDLVLWYDQPASAWQEALPLGNGKTGAMVFRGIDSERFQLNDNTLWSGYPDPGNNPHGQKYLPLVRKAVEEGDYGLAEKYWKKMQGTYSARYLHMGNLFLDFPFKIQDATNYRRSLDLSTAISSVSFNANSTKYTRETFISYPDKVMVIRILANKNLKTMYVHSGFGGNCRVRTSAPVTVIGISHHVAKDPNTNALMPSPAKQDFKYNAQGKSNVIEDGKTYVIDFQTEKGKSYKVVPL
jgi:hypothetical protein